MTELVTVVQQLGTDLSTLFVLLVKLAVPYWLALVWVATWLWVVDWRRLWPTLAEGAWAPLTLLVLMIALVWAMVAPQPYPLNDDWAVANFWWQLGAVGLLVSVAFFCGWLQGVLQWYPVGVALESPTPDAHSDHGAEVPHGHPAEAPAAPLADLHSSGH